MRSKMIAILITLISLSGCETTPSVVPVIVPPKHYSGTVKLSEIKQCPVPVQKSVYIHLRSREQYIETLIDVIKAHNGE